MVLLDRPKWRRELIPILKKYHHVWSNSCSYTRSADVNSKQMETMDLCFRLVAELVLRPIWFHRGYRPFPILFAIVLNGTLLDRTKHVWSRWFCAHPRGFGPGLLHKQGNGFPVTLALASSDVQPASHICHCFSILRPYAIRFWEITYP